MTQHHAFTHRLSRVAGLIALIGGGYFCCDQLQTGEKNRPIPAVGFSDIGNESVASTSPASLPSGSLHAAESAPSTTSVSGLSLPMNSNRPTDQEYRRQFCALLEGVALTGLKAAPGSGDEQAQEANRNALRQFTHTLGEIPSRASALARLLSQQLADHSSAHGNPPVLQILSAYIMGYGKLQIDDGLGFLEPARKQLPPPDAVVALPPLLQALDHLCRSRGAKNNIRDREYRLYLDGMRALISQSKSSKDNEDPFAPASLLLWAMIDTLTFGPVAEFEGNAAAHWRKEPEAEALGYLFTGYAAVAEAFRLRGTGIFADESEANLKRVTAAATRAKRDFMACTTRKPDWPYPLAGLVVMGSLLQEDLPQLKLWTQQAAATRPDHSGIYNCSRTILFHPSVMKQDECLFAFALECLRSHRYDTYIPLHGFRFLIFSHFANDRPQQPDWRALWRNPQIQQEMDALFPALIARSPEGTLRELWQIQYAAVKMWMGRYAEAKADFARLPHAAEWMELPYFYELMPSFFNQTWQQTQQELEANTGPYAERIAQGEQRVFNGRVAAGMRIWKEIIQECRSTHPDVAQYLLWRGAFVLLPKEWRYDQPYDLSEDRLYVAALKGHFETVQWLIDNGDDPFRIFTGDKNPWQAGMRGQSAFFAACRAGNAKIVSYLLERGVPPEQLDRAQGHFGLTPLASAAADDHINVMQLLLNHGAKIDAQGREGETALYVAVDSLHPDAINLLLDAGADVNLRGTKKQMPPVMQALMEPDESVAKLLVQRGADINLTQVDGVTPLMLASVQGLDSFVELLLQKGADVNVKVKSSEFAGFTALHYAVLSNKPSIAQRLIKAGAAIHAQAQDGRDPLYEAVNGNRLEMARCLLKNGAKPDESRFKGTASALMAAANKGNPDMVRLLLEHDANPALRLGGNEALTVTSDKNQQVILLLKTALANRKKHEPSPVPPAEEATD